MNKKEHYSFKLQFPLTHQISRSYIADKFKAEKILSLSEKLKQLASNLLGKDKLLNGIVFHRHCFAALDVFDWVYIFMAGLSYHSPDDLVTI